MFYWTFILLLLLSCGVSAQNVASSTAVVQADRILIHSITMDGFMLQDKNQFTKLFKPHINKYLSKTDMDMILQKVQDIYDQGGFQQLVSITYSVKKHHLTFMVAMTS
jgi:Skp family chaperone for outer membrane proteins